ncbi:MAG: hypothetical protein R2856_10165 [Caldilineaceae bacterium]
MHTSTPPATWTTPPPAPTPTTTPTGVRPQPTPEDISCGAHGQLRSPMASPCVCAGATAAPHATSAQGYEDGGGVCLGRRARTQDPRIANSFVTGEACDHAHRITARSFDWRVPQAAPASRMRLLAARPPSAGCRPPCAPRPR